MKTKIQKKTKKTYEFGGGRSISESHAGDLLMRFRALVTEHKKAAGSGASPQKLKRIKRELDSVANRLQSQSHPHSPDSDEE